MALRRRLRAWTWVAAAGLGALAAMTLDQPIVAAGMVALGAVRHRHLTGSSRRASVGAQAERLVARRIRRVRPAVHRSGVWLRGGSGDLDALVLGPMAAIVEVKYGRGRVRPERSGGLVVGRRRLPGRPMASLCRNGDVLERHLRISVDLVLCVTEMSGRSRRVWYEGRMVRVCSARRLPGVLRSLERRLTAADAHRLDDRLTAITGRPRTG